VEILKCTSRMRNARDRFAGAPVTVDSGYAAAQHVRFLAREVTEMLVETDDVPVVGTYDLNPPNMLASPISPGTSL
jgi:hypothetical protein